MNALAPYSLPIQGMKLGIHQFDFQIDKSFFENFEDSPIEDGNFKVSLQFDRKTDMFVLDFDYKGTVATLCDRCLADINLPIIGQQELIVKLTEENLEDDADVVFISPEAHAFNVAQYIYEYLCLSVPISKTYNCEKAKPRPCNMETLKYLSTQEEANTSDDEDNGGENPMWTEFRKKLKD